MKNADIYINGERAVYDEKTLVGTILRNFDFTDPTNRKQAYTNSIKLPVMENQHIFAFASEPGYAGSIPYTRVSVEIIVDGYLLLKDGIGYLDDVQDGYYIVSIREQSDLIQAMRDRSLSTSLGHTGPFVGNIVQALINATSGIKVDFFFNEQTRLYAVANPTVWRLYKNNGNFSVYVHSIFTQVGILEGITFAGSLMTDASFLNLRIVMEKACLQNNGGTYTFSDEDINSKHSFFDLFKAVLQMFGAVYTISGSTITIDRYDDLVLSKVDWSGKLQKVISKKFRIPNLAQNNYMRFKTGGEAEEKLNESVWACNNKNIEFEGTIIEPDVMVYPFLSLVGLMNGFTASTDKAINLPDSSFAFTAGAFPSLIESISSISDIVFIVDGPTDMKIGHSYQVEYTIYGGGSGFATYTPPIGGDNRSIAVYYNSQGDYARFAAMLANPLMYETEIDLDVLDLHDYSPFNLPIVPELAGEFYVNRLQYNFEKRGKASKATLIKYIEP